MIVPVVALYAVDRLSATIEQVGMLISAFFVASVLAKVPLGVIGGSLEPGRTMPFSLLLMTFASALYYSAPTVGVFALGRALGGLAFALFAISTMTVSAYVSKDRAHAVGMYTTSLALGLMAGPALGALLIPVIHTRNTLLASAVPLLTALVLSLRMTTAKVANPSLQDMRLMPRMKRILTNRTFDLALLAYFCFAFVLAVVVAYAPLYGREAFGFTDAAVTGIFAGYFTVTALTRMVITQFAYSNRLRWMIFGGLANAGALLSIMPFLNSPPAFAASIILLGITHGIVYPSSLMMVFTGFARGDLLLASSIFLTGFDLGGVLGPLVISPVAASLGLAHALALSAILPISTAFLFLILPPSRA